MLIAQDSIYGASPDRAIGWLRGGASVPTGALQSGKRTFDPTIGRPVSTRVAFLPADVATGLGVESFGSASTGLPRARAGNNLRINDTGIAVSPNAFARIVQTIATLGAGGSSGSIEIAKIRTYLRMEGRIAAPPAPEEVASAILDGSEIEPGLTLREAMRLMASVLAGKVSGAEGSQIVFRAAGSDHKVRLTVQADADGNRLAIVSDPGE